MKSTWFSILLFLFSLSVLANEIAPFTVTHIAPTGKAFENPPYKHMWYYRTEIKNTSDKPLRIVWFEGYMNFNNHWYGSNVLNEPLRSEEFSQWYTEGAKIINGLIPPGATAVCDVNYHGSDEPDFIRTKWSYIAVDEKGNDYLVESEVDQSIVFAK